MLLNSPIDSLPNTSSTTIRRLKFLGIETYWDLLNYFPYRYEDYSIISPIIKVQEGENVTIIGQIADSKYQVTRTSLRIQKFILQDETGTMELNWYNRPYLLTLLKKGMTISVAGEVKRYSRKIGMDPKEYEIIGFDLPALPAGRSIDRNNLKHTGRLVPIYSEKRGLSTKTIREKVWAVLKTFNTSEVILEEFLPREIIMLNNLISEDVAYRNVHFPENVELEKKSRDRISFDELFIMQLTSKLVKKEWEKEVVEKQFKINTAIKKNIDTFIQNLPFILTKAQKKATDEILSDLQKGKPMNRFLQGEVGSGKTVVAAIACYVSCLNGFQSLFMAPTEILAEQHYQTIMKLFSVKETSEVLSSTSVSNLGGLATPKICLVTGSTKPQKKELEEADIIIGTHALIQKNIQFNKVGFVVIDEQHRFGVAQRAELKNKGLNPHLLTMTATPIPRTVMLTLYGELDVSVLDEMPVGRFPIKTYFIPKQKRTACYEWIKKQIEIKKAQVYIICPLIEESEVETLQSINPVINDYGVKAAKKEYEYLKNEIFTHFSVGLLHGKLTSKEKNQVMNDFKNKKYAILVATPVVEVGIDVPAATGMIIEGAERFGLAQLHQLRGRVGRGKEQSYCFVFSGHEDQTISERLKYFTKTQDGNALAEKDLQIRGPGNLYGTEQHGYLELKLASLSDFPMIEKTRKAVHYFIQNYELNQFEELKKRVENLKIGQISRD